MISNPMVVRHDTNSYSIQFIRKNLTVLNWVMDLSGPKLKTFNTNLPVIQFESKDQAEITVKTNVIPYILAFKDIEPQEIIGW